MYIGREMGQSTDGIICYGVDLGEELPWVANEEVWGKLEEHGFGPDDCDDEVMAYLLGGLPMFKSDLVSGTDEWGVEYTAYYKERDRILKDFGVTLVRHCSGECPMYILAMTSTVKEASRGTPEELDIPSMMSAPCMPYAISGMEEAMQKIGVTGEFNPKWLLCSMWS